MTRKIKSILLTCLAVISISTACKKTETKPAAVVYPTTPSMTATINGKPWKAQVTTAAYSTGTRPVGIDIVGDIPNPSLQVYNTIRLHLPINPQKGIYAMDSMNATYTTGQFVFYQAFVGTITVLEFSNNIINGTYEGTFEIPWDHTKKDTITNGVFTAKLK